MSHIISPEERAIEWRETSAQRGDDRERRLHYLAVHMLEELRSEFDLYGGYEDEFVESLLLLDGQEELFDHEMMIVYQFVGTDEESGGRLLALIAARLASIAARSPDELGTRAGLLADLWRERMLAAEREGESYITVAQVAARYAVTPQAVYKWIQKGKVVAEETPGGSYRIPSGQFMTTRATLERRAQTRRRLLDHAGDSEPISDEEVAEAIRRTRRESSNL